MTRLPTPPPTGDNMDDADEARTLSLLGGVARPEGLPEADVDLGSMRGSSRLSGGTLVVVGVCAVAAIALYTMKLSHGPVKSDAATKAVEAKIEQALAKLIAPENLPKNDPLLKSNMDSLFRDTDAIVAMFNQDMTQRQVPIDYVKKNPFALGSPAPTEIAAPTGPSHDARRLSRLRAELGDLQLQTVMLGARPVAVISSEIVRPGDKLGSFTVKEIRQFSVVLQAEGHVFALEMPKPDEQPAGRR